MISYEQALALISEAAPAPVRRLPLAQAAGRVAAEDHASGIAQPPFANSAMDGFAVRSIDLTAASRAQPAVLDVLGSAAAGDAPAAAAAGKAWEIMTGAPVPDGYDAVVKIEDAAVLATGAAGRPTKVSFAAPATAGANIRVAGEDFAPGDLVLKTGSVIGPFQIMALAAAGKAEVAVYPQPRITVFSTGKELAAPQGGALAPGQIHNSNGPYLLAALGELSAACRFGGVNADRPKQFAGELTAALAHSDVVISTGAVSAGRHDFVPRVLADLGAAIVFHKLAVRPGKPALYARLPDGTHYFGLPGNPGSTAVGLRFLVLPLLRSLQGLPAEVPIYACLSNAVSNLPKLRCFLKASLGLDDGGALRVRVLPGQESFKIRPLLEANCWVSVAPIRRSAQAGERVEVFSLVPDSWSLGAPAPA